MNEYTKKLLLSKTFLIWTNMVNNTNKSSKGDCWPNSIFTSSPGFHVSWALWQSGVCKQKSKHFYNDRDRKVWKGGPSNCKKWNRKKISPVYDLCDDLIALLKWILYGILLTEVLNFIKLIKSIVFHPLKLKQC